MRVGESHQILTGAISFLLELILLLYMALILLFAIASIVIIDFIGRTIWKYMGAVCGFNSSLWSDDVPYEENLLYAFPDYK